MSNSKKNLKLSNILWNSPSFACNVSISFCCSNSSALQIHVMLTVTTIRVKHLEKYTFLAVEVHWKPVPPPLTSYFFQLRNSHFQIQHQLTRGSGCTWSQRQKSVKKCLLDGNLILNGLHFMFLSLCGTQGFRINLGILAWNANCICFDSPTFTQKTRTAVDAW